MLLDNWHRQLAGRQIVTNERHKPDGFQANLVQDDEKDARGTGAQPSGVIYSVVP